MKKIVHVVEAFGGGVYSFLSELCNGLSKEYEIVIIYSERKETPKHFQKDFNDNIRFININMCRGLNPYKNIKALFQLKNILKKENAEIIHLHSSKAGFLGRVVCFINKFDMNKVFYNPHGFSFLQKNECRFKRNLYFILEKLAGKFGGTIVGCSKGEYEEALKVSSKCVNINNSIDVKKIEKIIIKNNVNTKVSKKNNEITIGTIGRICCQKNPTLFNYIAKRFPKYNFIWIGDGNLKHELSSSNIRVTGWEDREKVIEDLIKLDVFIMTSLWEGLPICLLEAMYLSKPVVVSDVIGNRDAVIHKKSGFVSKSKEDFIIYINKLLNDDDLKSKMEIEANKQVIEKFSITKMMEKYKYLYN